MNYNRRIKKLKKLSHLSKEIINQYGLPFFLKVGSHELKKQGFSLFDPDIESQFLEVYDDSVNYQKFLQKSELDFKNNIQPSISKSSQIDFLFLLFDTSNNIKLLENSVKSFIEQDFDSWKIIIVSNHFPNQSLLSDNRIDYIDTAEFSTKINELLLKSSAKYVGLLKSGCGIYPDSLFRICYYIDQNSQNDIVYSDNDQLDNGTRKNSFFKPEWSSYLLLHYNYIGNFFLTKKEFFVNSGISDIIINKNVIFELLLHFITNTKKIGHIAFPLFYETNHTIDSNQSSKKAVIDTLKKLDLKGTVKDGLLPQTFRIIFETKTQPLVSIIIPSKNNITLLQKCIQSLKNKTSYKNWELIIVDNNSNKKTKLFLSSLRFPVLNYDSEFNFANMCNLGANNAKGEYLLFLNDDTRIIDSDWLTEMIRLCTQKDVGIVGPKLLYDFITIQHAGISFLKSGTGFHPFQTLNEYDEGYNKLLNTVRECSAVTGACLLIKKELFDKVGQFNEYFDVYYGDSDLCLKILQEGYKVIYTPFAKLIHQGSASIKKSSEQYIPIENQFYFKKKWPHLIKGDPYYNPNLGWDYQISP